MIVNRGLLGGGFQCGPQPQVDLGFFGFFSHIFV
jgi:hypothetical protein